MRARFEASGDGCKVTSAEDNNDSNCAEEPAEVVGAAGPQALPNPPKGSAENPVTLRDVAIAGIGGPAGALLTAGAFVIGQVQGD